MNTDNKDMRNFLGGLQKMQREDDFLHNMRISASVTEDGSLMINASFESIIEKDEDGDPRFYHCNLYGDSTYRWNKAEYMKFQLLLNTDK